PPDGLHPSGGVGQDLGCHRVVVRRQLAPAVQAGVHPHAGAAGEMEEIHPSGAGAEPLHRVFGVDAALDGMALERHILLPQAQRQAGGNPQLLAHQIHTGDQLGDAVLYLDAGVHLHEIEMLPVRVQQELHCAGILIANGFGRLYGGGAHPLPQLRRQTPGRGLLDELLVPPLDRAVPVPQMDDVAVAVRQHLELDVPGPEHQFL
ncbi:putative HD-superfamily hydrolase, partial [Dysosmobacter welbionis]